MVRARVQSKAVRRARSPRQDAPSWRVSARIAPYPARGVRVTKVQTTTAVAGRFCGHGLILEEQEAESEPQ